MPKFVIVQGHPDPAAGHLNRALADCYVEAAIASGQEVRRIDVAGLDFPILRRAEDFVAGAPPESITAAQHDIAWADHVVFFYPLWIGDMPALLKAFVEQTFRPGFAMETSARGFPKGLLSGKSARIVVTMGMPAIVYRTYFGAHTLKSLALNLRMCGVAPVSETVIGGVGSASERTRRKWLANMARLARRDALPQKPDVRTFARLLVPAGLAVAGAYAGYAALTWARFGNAKHTSSLLGGAMPEYDVRLRHEVTVRAPAAVTFEAMRHMDFERSPIVAALFRTRELLLGVRHVERPRGHDLLEQLENIGWRIVAEESGKELVFGAVTQPWQANPIFRGLPANEFSRFDLPGYAKIAFTLRVDPLDTTTCVARTETRVETTDPTSRARFRQYWALLSPGVELIRIILLAQLKSEAEARWQRSPKEITSSMP